MLVLNEAQRPDSTVSVMKDDARSPASELRQSTYAKSQENGELGLSEEDYRKSAEEVAEGHNQEEAAEEEAKGHSQEESAEEEAEGHNQEESAEEEAECHSQEDYIKQNVIRILSMTLIISYHFYSFIH